MSPRFHPDLHVTPRLIIPREDEGGVLTRLQPLSAASLENSTYEGCPQIFRRATTSRLSARCRPAAENSWTAPYALCPKHMSPFYLHSPGPAPTGAIPTSPSVSKLKTFGVSLLRVCFYCSVLERTSFLARACRRIVDHISLTYAALIADGSNLSPALRHSGLINEKRRKIRN